MGAWGVKINQNDVYADIKDFYTAFLKCGMSNEEALNNTLIKFDSYAKDTEDGDLFWLSLADIMWQMGRLTEDVKKNAVSCIDSSNELKKWYAISKESGDERKKNLEELKSKLVSEQPKIKKFGKKRYKQCIWSDGDIYRYEFKGELAEKYNMLNMYLWVQKIGDFFFEDPVLRAIKPFISNPEIKQGDVFPIVRIWITNDKQFLPIEKNRIEFISTIGTRGVNESKDYRFYILDFPSKCDEFEFICNSNIVVPDNEDINFINEYGIKPKHLTWKFFDKHVIGRYLHWAKGIDIFQT